MQAVPATTRSGAGRTAPCAAPGRVASVGCPAPRAPPATATTVARGRPAAGTAAAASPMTPSRARTVTRCATSASADPPARAPAPARGARPSRAISQRTRVTTTATAVAAAIATNPAAIHSAALILNPDWEGPAILLMDQARSHRSGQVSRGRNRDEQVNGAGPDGQGRDERADDDEPAEQLARIPVRGHRSRRADHSGGEDDQCPVPAGQSAPMPRRPGRRLRGLPLPPRGKPATVGRDRRRRPLIQVRCNEPQVVPGRLCGAWPYRALVAPTRPHRVLLIAPRPRPRLAELARFRSRLVLLTAARSGPARFRWSPVGPVWLTRSRVASGWFRWCPVGPAWLTRSRVASAWFRWSPVGPAWLTWSRVASARFRRAGFPAAGRQRTWPGPPRLPAADRTPARTTPAGLGAALITARPGIRPVRLEHRAVVRPVRARLVWARLVWARLVWDRPLRARLVWDRPLRARLVRDRPLRARLVRARPLRARLVRARPLRARLVPDRPLRARLVRARLVKPGIGLGGATVAARLAPVRPEGSTGRTRRRRPGIRGAGAHCRGRARPADDQTRARHRTAGADPCRAIRGCSVIWTQMLAVADQ